MAALVKRWRWLGMLAVLTAAAGCNLKTLPYFLFSQDNRHPPDCEELESPKKEVRVVFLVNLGAEVGPDFIRADRDLNEMLVHELRRRYQEDKVKIVIVPPGQVESFKERNPSWQTKSMGEVGKALHADYVVNIDLEKLSLYEQRSYNELFRGQAEVSVSVFNVQKPEEERIFNHPFTYTFPSSGPVPVLEDNNPALFRQNFLAHLARELMHCFAKYSNDEKYACD